MAYKRTSGKNNADCKLKDLYKHYKKTTKNPVEYNVYSEFLKEYNERIIKAMIYDNLEFKLPYRLGFIRIQKRKKVPYMKDEKLVLKHISPDWKRTLDSWRKAYPDKTDEEIKLIPNKKVLRHHNDHTNGYSVRFYWDKRYSNAINQTCYVFKTTRTAKEELASYVKKVKILEYFE